MTSYRIKKRPKPRKNYLPFSWCKIWLAYYCSLWAYQLGAGQAHLLFPSFWLGQSVSAPTFCVLSRLRSALLAYRSCIYNPSSYSWIYNIKLLDCVSRSVIFWKIQSCDKEFFFPQRHVDLFDVEKVVPNKDEPIPYTGFTRRIYDRSSKTLDTRSFKLLEWKQISGEQNLW